MAAIPTPHNIDAYPCGFRREWYLDYQLVVYVVPWTTPQTLHTWGEVATQTGVDWPDGRLYLGMHDFSTAHIVFSPTAYTTALHMAYSTTHLHGYFAGIVSNTVIANTLDRLLTLNILPTVPKLQMRLFATREAGLEWLRSHLTD